MEIGFVKINVARANMDSAFKMLSVRFSYRKNNKDQWKEGFTNCLWNSAKKVSDMEKDIVQACMDKAKQL